jgi:aryl-alcohol dehydrogenase-like predicted oxidoreductase
MKYIQLGKTDMNVSRICFGSWQLSASYWGEVPLGPWEAALRKALELGVNFIDTADVYGQGHAEKSLGSLLKREGLRDRFMIATKFYYTMGGMPGSGGTGYDYILRACEASLQRLQTDRIDLYQIHDFDPLTRPDEVAAAMTLLRKQGKIRWFGVSNVNAEQMRMYEQFLEMHCLQPEYSLLERDVEKADLPYCLGRRIGVIAYSPQYRGLLTGKYARDQVFTDKRGKDKLFTGKSFQRMLDGLDEMRPLAAELGLTVPQLAVRWVLTHPAVTSAIVGIKTPEHVESIVAAADDVLPFDKWHRTAGIMRRAKADAMAL